MREWSMRRVTLFLLVSIVSVEGQTCTATGGNVLAGCLTLVPGTYLCPTGATCLTSTMTCCYTQFIVYTTTTTTTAAPTTTTACVDLVNPGTGTSDCAARAYLCSNSNYYTLMSQQCPRTCGRCSSSSASSSSSPCVDLSNPSTGTSDCSRLSYLCSNPVYTSVMAAQCRATCGLCSSSSGSSSGSSSASSSSSSCTDLANPATGASDCAARSSLCSNSAYASLMAVQCRATCGFCSG